MLRLHINLEHPQPRHISRAVATLRAGGVAIYPTDTTYGLGCDLFLKRTISRIYQLKNLNSDHLLSFLCSDLSEVARFAVVDDQNYRILRHHLPGPYTFILPATRETPKFGPANHRTVGVRIPSSPVCLALLRELGHPIISTTVGRVNNGDAESTFLNDPDDIVATLGRSVDLFLDAGLLLGEPSSVIDLTGTPKVVRRGAGDLSWLE